MQSREVAGLIAMVKMEKVDRGEEEGEENRYEGERGDWRRGRQRI